MYVFTAFFYPSSDFAKPIKNTSEMKSMKKQELFLVTGYKN